MYKNTDNPHIYIQSRFWKHWLISLGLTVFLIFIMTKLHSVAVRNLLEIEFASNAETFRNLILKVDNLETNTFIDFLFMIAYTGLFYFSGRVVYDLLQFSSRKLLFVLFFPLIFDVIENLLLLQMLDKTPSEYLNFSIFYYSVRLKWLFAIPGVIVFIVVLIYHIYALLDRIYEAKEKSA